MKENVFASIKKIDNLLTKDQFEQLVHARHSSVRIHREPRENVISNVIVCVGSILQYTVSGNLYLKRMKFLFLYRNKKHLLQCECRVIV